MQDIEVDIFWRDIDISLDDVNKEDLQRRRDERLHNCMKAVIVKEKEDGGRVYVKWRCKDPRCDYCNGIKADKLKARIQRCVDAGLDVYYIVMPMSISQKFVRKLGGRENYLRVPYIDEVDIIFFLMEKNNRRLEKLTDLDVVEFDWMELARRKDTRIISGTLGDTVELPKETTGEYVIELLDIVAYPEEIVNKAHIQTYAHDVIAWQQPESVEESREYHRRFNATFVRNIMDMGGKLYNVYYHEQGCTTFSIDFFDIEKFPDPI
jgi:hypothetical protein